MIKVAVIGAGLSGLACAHELERHGIFPVIFEKRHRPGDLFDHSGAILEILTRPRDPAAILKKDYNLHLRPLSAIKSITMNSPRKKATVRGNLGYFFMRGHSPKSVENQLYAKLKSRLVSSTSADWAALSRQFDFVVVANGSADISREAGVWTAIYPAKMVGGTVIGDFFDPTNMKMWIDTRYAKTAYAYLTPIDQKRAFLALVAPECTVEEIRRRWKLFWEIEGFSYTQINEVIVEHNAGFVYPHQVGNVLFVGIAGGFLDPFLGFGALTALKSGVLAARAIAEGKRFEDLLLLLRDDLKHARVFREQFNRLQNRDYDLLMAALGIPGLKQLIYNTRLDVMAVASSGLTFLKSAAQRFKNG